MITCVVGSGLPGFPGGLVLGCTVRLVFWGFGWVSSAGSGCLVCLVLGAAVPSWFWFACANVFWGRLVQVPTLQVVTVSVPFGSFCMLKMASS